MKDAMPDFKIEQSDGFISIEKDSCTVKIDLKKDCEVSSENAIFKERVQKILDNY